MAGFEVPVSKAYMLDFGYRYIDLGKIETSARTIADSGGNPLASDFDGLTGKLRAHELFVGVRF
jgi:opacity protein-like surface antigen